MHSPDCSLGLLQGDDSYAWSGNWVWTDSAEQARNTYAFFRRTFHMPIGGLLAVNVTADSFYELFIDGRRIGRGPARAHLAYYSFDYYELPLDAGAHVVAIRVHHIGVENATVMTGRPGLLTDLAAPGMTLGTDASWKCLRATAWRSDLPCLMSHFGFWEECRLNEIPTGWTTLCFDDSSWNDACEIGKPPCSPWMRLIMRDIPLPHLAEVSVKRIHAMGSWWPGEVAEDDENKRKSIAGGWLPEATTRGIPSKEAAVRRRTPTTAPETFPLHLTAAEENTGTWVTLDFGRTVSGYPVLQVEASECGLTMDLSYDDVVKEDGSVNPERSYARMTDRFHLCSGINNIHLCHPRGFRFVTVDLKGSGAVLRHASVTEETYPFAQPAEFTSSDNRLKSYLERSAETVRICTTDAFTDCASRERVQWMEDLYLHGRVAAYAFGDVALLRRALFQGAQNALPDGRINGFMPSERTGCAFASSSLIWLHALVDYWLFSGETEDCRRLLPTAARLLQFIQSVSDDQGLITWKGGQFWDWSPVEDNGCILLTNAFTLWALRRLAEHEIFLPLLGNHHPARLISLREACRETFWDTGRQLFRDAPLNEVRTPIFSQHANSLAVLSGLCPESERPALLRKIIDPKNLGPIPIGEQALWKGARPASDRIVPVGTLWFGHFLCQALFEARMTEEALTQMHLLWGEYDHSPTLPETRISAGNTTQCHGWAAGPAFLLPAYLLGVQPANGGWSQVRVSPHTGSLRSASGSIPTPYGRISIAWQQTEDGKLQVTIDTPASVQVIREDKAL